LDSYQKSKYNALQVIADRLTEKGEGFLEFSNLFFRELISHFE
jgi:hypothetical protein